MFKKSTEKLNFYDRAKKAGMIFPELVNYFKMMERDNSPHSVRGYQDSISRFLIYFNIYSLKDMEKIKFSFKEEEKELNVIPANNFDFVENIKYNSLMIFEEVLHNDMIYRSVNTHILRIKGFWKYFYDKGDIENYCINRLKLLEKKFYDKEVNAAIAVTRQEQEGMINSCKNIRKKLLLTMMFGLGLRREEAAGLTLANISNCRVKFKGKGNKPADIALSENICNLLQEYLKVRESDSLYLFYSNKGNKGKSDKLSGQAISDSIKKAAKDSGIAGERLEKISGHTPRHTFCVNVVEDYDIYTASKMCRHSTISTTEKFYAEIRQGKLDAAYTGMK